VKSREKAPLEGFEGQVELAGGLRIREADHVAQDDDDTIPERLQPGARTMNGS